MIWREQGLQRDNLGRYLPRTPRPARAAYPQHPTHMARDQKTQTFTQGGQRLRRCWRRRIGNRIARPLGQLPYQYRRENEVIWSSRQSVKAFHVDQRLEAAGYSLFVDRETPLDWLIAKEAAEAEYDRRGETDE